MQYILSENNRAVLKDFTSLRVLLAFDFDGTLAAIVSDPHKAAIRPTTRSLLRQLTSLYPCIVVSGRSRSDVRQKLSGIQFKEFIGNHGIEPWKSSGAAAREVQTWIPILKRKLESCRGLTLEDKRFSVSIHYRRARNKKNAIKAIASAARTLPGVRLVGGKNVVNIVLGGAPHKGSAVERALQKERCDTAIYVGDDVTDEGVFALARSKQFLAIRVGANSSSLAPFYIRHQREIDRLLKALLQLRGQR